MEVLTVEKVVEHDAAGRITRVIEHHHRAEPPKATPAPTPQVAISLTAAADQAMAGILEAVARPEVARTGKGAPMLVHVTVHNDSPAFLNELGAAVRQRLAQSQNLGLIAQKVGWSELRVTITPAPSVSAVGRQLPRPAAPEPRRRVGFVVAGNTRKA